MSNEAIDEAIRSQISEIRTVEPGIVLSDYDKDTGTVSCRLSIKREAVILSGSTGKHKTKQELTIDLDLVPVHFSGSGRTGIITQPKKGDRCCIKFCGSNIQKWYESGDSINDNVDSRRHNLSDAVCEIGLEPSTQPVTPSIEGTAIQSKDGQHYIGIDDSGSLVSKSTQSNLQTGEYNLDSDGDYNLSSGSAKIQVDGLTINSQSDASIESMGESSFSGITTQIEGFAGVNITGGGITLDTIFTTMIGVLISDHGGLAAVQAQLALFKGGA